MKIKSGKYDVLLAGSIMQFENEPIVFDFEDSTVTFTFLADKGNPSYHSKNEVKDNNLIINLYNFNQNIRTQKPVLIGDRDGREFYVNYAIDTGGPIILKVGLPWPSPQRTLIYTFYLGDEISNGD